MKLTDLEVRAKILFVSVICFSIIFAWGIIYDLNGWNKLIYGFLFAVCLVFLYLENTKTASVKGAGLEIKIEAQERNNQELKDEIRKLETEKNELNKKIEQLEIEKKSAKEKITELETKLKEEEVKNTNPNIRSIKSPWEKEMKKEPPVSL